MKHKEESTGDFLKKKKKKSLSMKRGRAFPGHLRSHTASFWRTETASRAQPSPRQFPNQVRCSNSEFSHTLSTRLCRLNKIVLDRWSFCGRFCPPGDISQRLETVLVVMAG